MDLFAPTRGLQQGDPLSLYLFLFVAAGLFALINKGMPDGVITSLKLTRRAPGISHLLFANDTLLFFKACEDQAILVKNILQGYAGATSQLINPKKCSIFFVKACPATQQPQVRNQLLGTQ